MVVQNVAHSVKDKVDSQALRGTESVMRSTDALTMVAHSSEVTINITTAVGIKYQGTTNFIGTHGNDLILLEIPDMSDEDKEYFLQDGFWLNVRAISPRGEGALLYFRSQMVHVVYDPVPMLMLSIPSTMKVLQLRKEPRYDVALHAILHCKECKIEAEIRDLSKGGCRIETSPLARNFQIDDVIRIELTEKAQSVQTLPAMSGKVCNLQRSQNCAKYGLIFDDLGRENVKKLLSCLKFDGTKLALK
ncbi:flagellar brake protein [Vibrio sp. SCSIO 43136]|uniref:flagellar brake protein n=1 Tax=Vibrio sp. SCSIO 43136 TaxID=2819101 RepID=UPI0020751745|nr:flagellar brake protein [Vibrio sp. SCSIO 43136]USD66941.1 flagellar brake protein [Vibrio sp. SCSIO 43136]